MKCHPCREGLDEFLKNQVDLDPEAKKILNDNLWDLYSK